jgi:hypothetical protein
MTAPCDSGSGERPARLGRFSGVALGLGVAGATGLAFYLYKIRPWHLSWHTTPEEMTEPMPGDDLIDNPTIELTRAITIAAPPAEVWPWLVQMGYRRAGWYSYDLFDNDNVHVNAIIPELQDLKVGELLATDANGGFRVEAIDPGRAIVAMIHNEEIGLPGDIVMCMMLRPLGPDGRHTRMTLRLRGRFWGVGRLWALLFDFGDFVFMRKMLLGIKERAEAAHNADHRPG